MATPSWDSQSIIFIDFHHDNALAYSSAIATAKIVELRYKMLSYLPYSPYLAPYYFFLFPKIKR